MKYIIQPGIKIGNPKIREINVLTLEEVNEYRNNGYKCRENAYQLKLGGIEYEVTCLEIWRKDDKEHSLIIPAFLIHRRVYPVYVYAFAINLYSSKPQLSQRKVAEATREEYGLETFAHTTVGRAMKALAKMLAEDTIIDAETTEAAAQEPEQDEASAIAIHTRRFPSVQDTSAHRKIIKSFFYERLKNSCKQDFKEACDRISIYWYTIFNRLLMNTAPGFGCKLSIVTQST